MISPSPRRLICGCLLATLAWLVPAPGMSAELVSYAAVRPDATLLVGSRVVRLYGIYVPPGPFEYHVLERIARNTNMGVWGMHAVAVAASSKAR